MYKPEQGFSLLELILVVSIIMVISSIGSSFYVNYNKSIEISSLAETLVSDLKQMQAKAMIGEGGLKWGVHFVNTTTDYYELFSTPTDYSNAAKVIFSTNNLSGNISFTDPTIGTSKDIVFNKVSGGTTASSVALGSSNITKTVSISALGNISVQ